MISEIPVGRYYILKEDHEVVLEPDFTAWNTFMETMLGPIFYDRDEEQDVTVSTIFLGRDCNIFGLQSGKPHLFETMIIGGPRDSEIWRASTWEEADRVHRASCLLVGIDQGAVK